MRQLILEVEDKPLNPARTWNFLEELLNGLQAVCYGLVWSGLVWSIMGG